MRISVIHHRLMGAIRFIQEACERLPMSATDTRVLISADAQCAIQRWGKEHEADKFSKILCIVTLHSEYTRALTF